jgi:hypothetical protein
MTDFSDTREWWPACLMDEWMPQGRRAPQDWLKPDAAGVTTFWWDESEAEPRAAGTAAPGETVAFCWHERRGRVTIRLMPGGAWSIEGDARAAHVPDLFTGEVKPDLPAARIDDATHFWEASDAETTADSMDEFARNYAEPMPPAEDGDLVEVSMGRWGEERFTVSANGASLTPAETVDG